MGNKELLKQKLELEYKRYYGRVLVKDKKYLLENAGKVYMMENLYKSAVDQCSGWTEEEIQMLLIFPGLLEYLFRKWKKAESALPEEIGRCIRKECGRIITAYRETTDAA